MNITPQIIEARVALTFAFYAVLAQQAFAYPAYSRAEREPADYEISAWKSVIITEIMPDPSPPIGLPDAEFIELYNRSDTPVPLDGWKISDTSSSVKLGNTILQPHQYLVLTAKEELFGNGIAMNVPNLPSLNNTGDSLTLTNDSGEVIDILVYTDDWYGDSARSNGGWSLELIDPENTCEVAGNWSISEDPRGGTPGEQNSILASNPDVSGPLILSAHPLDAFTLRLEFNEALSSESAYSAQWSFTPALSVVNALLPGNSLTVIDLRLASAMQHGVLYELTMTSILDCAGNPSTESKRKFALPEPGVRGDIVINEVLFNPPPDGADYVELLNVSKKYVDLNGWAIGTYDDDGTLEISRITQSVILAPDGIIALSPRPLTVQAQYAVSDSSMLEVKLPGYADDKGIVVMLNSADSVIEIFNYSDDMHNPFIRDPEGVSLERISPILPADDPSNWTSAGSWEGYGTPGRRNSAERNAANSEKVVRVTPAAFSPPDGQPNYADISYHFNQSGYVANVNVYDSRGMIIRRLVNNAVLGTAGTIRWAGERDDGSRAQTGYYMVWFQVFGSNGTSKVYREAVAIAPRFR